MQAVCAHSRTKTLDRKRKQWRTASRRDARGSSCKKVDLNGRGSDESTCTRKGVLREEEPVKGESLKKKKTTAEEVKGWERQKEPEGYSGIVQRDRREERKKQEKDVREGERMRAEGRGRERT